MLKTERPLRVILFIGHHKVGSTALQDFLARNAVALAQAGILYPFVEFQGLARMAAAAARTRIDDDPLPINAREPHNALAFRMLASRPEYNRSVPPFHKMLPAVPQMLHAISQQIDAFQPHTVILAAEVFANFNAVDPALIKRLVDWLPSSEITLVATFRRMDEYLASWQGQRLKFGHRLKPLREDGLAEFLSGIHFDYRLMLEGWLQALPDADLVLRDYADVRTAGGSVADFINQTGLAVPAGLAPERRENDSLHRAVYEIVRRANHEMHPEKAAELRNTLRERGPDLRLPSSSSIELFGAGNRRQLVERFRPIDSWLGSLKGQAGFFQDLEAALITHPLAEMKACRKALAALAASQIELSPEARAFLERLQVELQKGVS